MEFIQEFIINYYIWIVVICAFIVFTLIGYLVDKNDKKNLVNNEDNKKEVDVTEINNMPIADEPPKTLDELIQQSKLDNTKNNIEDKKQNQENSQTNDENSIIINETEQVLTPQNNNFK